MNETESKNGMSNFDAVDSEGGDVAALLRALPRVKTPGDFEVRVKGKIAVRRQAPMISWIPFLKIAAPLSLVLLIGAFVAFYGLLPSGTEVPVVTDTARKETTVSAPAFTSPQPSAPVGSTVSQVPQRSDVLPETSVVTEKAIPVRRVSNSYVARPNQGGSLDFSLNSAKPKLPAGFEGIQPRNSNTNINSSVYVPVRDVLGILGITAEFANGWKVRSVVENSVASRSDVRAGDAIEAIDGEPLKSDSVLKGSATTITVRRDGKTINLSLKN